MSELDMMLRLKHAVPLCALFYFLSPDAENCHLHKLTIPVQTIMANMNFHQ